jgi:hypothetical protein
VSQVLRPATAKKSQDLRSAVRQVPRVGGSWCSGDEHPFTGYFGIHQGTRDP